MKEREVILPFFHFGINFDNVSSMHKSEIFFYLISAFILGVFFGSVFDFSISVVLILAIVGISVIVLSGFIATPERELLKSGAGNPDSRLVLGRKNKYFILTGFMILVFAGGIARFNSSNLDNRNFLGQAGKEVALDGYINSEPEIDGNFQRFIFKTNGEGVLIIVKAFPRYKFGNDLRIVGTLELPKNTTDFDYVTYLKKDGIRLVLFLPEIENNTQTSLSFWDNLKLGLYKNIFIVKDRFEQAINLSIPEPNASFINGILLGSRQNIPDDLKQAFNKTSTTHILAISGYNIMIISEAVLLGLIWFVRRRVAFWISVGIIILFVILTGASASVVRAAVMGLLISFAHGYGRLYDQKNSIILAGAAMIWINPFVLVFDIGFQLSFAAVLGLIYLYPRINSKLYKIPKFGGIKELLLMTLSAQLAVLPLALYYFGNFSLVSLPTNILILSFLPYAMLGGFISGLAGMIFLPLGQAIGYIAWAITTYQIEVVRFFASIL